MRLLILTAILLIAGCMKVVDLKEYNDRQLQKERQHGSIT